MEKMNLARNVCKTVYGFRYRTINQRLKNTIGKFGALNDELFTAVPYLQNALASPEEAQHVVEVTEQYEKSVSKLASDYEHFKEHEEPSLMTCNMFRNYVTPSVTAGMVAVLVGAIAYTRHLKENYQGKLSSLSILLWLQLMLHLS
ncbi:hypothetical protein MKX03_002571 [Papaver bracteatum]|nr:hypothetical protein MKX03_002571 [Papaver bracteatum]